MLASLLFATAAIFHGSPAPLPEIPWFASLYEFGGPACGGSLIAPDRVLTAAHCVQGAGPRDYDVRIGGPSRPARGAYFPPGYRLLPSPLLPGVESASGSLDDIAVIVLRQPVTDVAPVPLATTAPADHEATLTVGRGFTGPSGDQPARPLASSQQVLPNAKCARTYHALFHASRHLCTLDPTDK